ncbi:MAG: hypothetical protein CXX81_08475, partial [Methanobacteriota archaeon]
NRMDDTYDHTLYCIHSRIGIKVNYKNGGPFSHLGLLTFTQLHTFSITLIHTNDMKGPLVGGLEGSACQ